MRYLGGVVLLAYAWATYTGWAPFSNEERGRVTGDVRRGPGGVLLWTGGYMGGK